MELRNEETRHRTMHEGGARARRPRYVALCGRSVAIAWIVLAVMGLVAKGEAVRVAELAGDGEQIGGTHGRQLGEQIRLLHEKYLKAFFGDQKLYKQALLGAFIYRNQLLPEHKAEIAALAAASGIDSGEVMLANCFLDMMPMTACSTITLPAAAAPDGVARFGRNLDFMSFDVADKYSVVLVVRPKDHYAFAAVSWPGLIGVLSGMNEHGLTLANMEVDRRLRMPTAMPYTLLYRMVLERCKTVEEAIELLQKTPRQSANNLMLMDAAGNRAVVEITPEKVVVRRGAERAALISTNHQRGEDQDGPGQCWRYDALNREAKKRFGMIDASAVEKLLGGVAQGKATLQSMVFEPANRVIYLAVGVEATKREYQKIDLREYFRKSPND